MVGSPWSVPGLAACLGMLAVDWVFDVGEAQAAKVYYCSLLPTLFSFPHCLRVVIPVAFAGICILSNLYASWSGQHGLAKVAHLATCAVLLFGGLPCFYVSVRSVQMLCGGIDETAQITTLQQAHAAMFVVFLASIAFEVAGHAARAKSAPDSKSKAT
ncbi:unnamed protein product [Symbiodinium natans]|uniref:Uncharacterized protein n=1 Tax=Symbiodinium natans TaxID=878477 RepID=A0A812I2Z5_9DINO|nr:unnamed protein product [Symbiodinium natans]